MAGTQDNKIFLGHTPIEQRKYITALFRHLHEKYPKLIVPAVGQFTLVKCAIEAGYKKENIQTSDISLFSSLLGYLYAGKPIDTLDFEFHEDLEKIVPDYKERYEACTSETEKVAFVMWVMKLAQLGKIHYRKLLWEDLLENREKHVNDLMGQIVKQKNYFEGIQYDIKDLRWEFEERSPDTLLVINPPVFKKGYTKMFDFRGYINYHSGVDEFDFKKEYVALYEKSKGLSYPVVWYRFRSAEGFHEDEVMYAKEYEVEKQDYWLITKPEIVRDFPLYKHIASFSRKNLRPYHLPIFKDGDVIDENTTVRFVTVPEEVALYYRDLFAHRLGNTGAEHHYLMLIGEKVFSCTGMTTSKLFRLQTNYIFENYGFSVSLKTYKRVNRLLMMMITSKEFAEVIRNTTSNKNRFYQLDGLKTTCLSKLRSIKTHQGILERTSREKMPNGMYKIQAATRWHERDFKETLKIWLAEEEAGRKLLTSETFSNSLE